MKTRWLFLAALLSLGVATVSVPCWLGRQMEHRFADGLERLMERTGIHLSRLTFERGWLHSVAITHWRAATALSGADGDTLTLRHVIDHDWAVALRWVFGSASITVHTTLAQDAVHAGHRQSGGDPEPIAILSWFSANGDSTHAITLASLSSRNLPPSRPGAFRSLTLSGLRGEIRLPARTEQGIQGSVRAEHLSLETAEQSTLTVRDVALEVTRAHDQVQSTDRLTTRLQLGSLAIVLSAARQRLQGQGIALNSLMTALPTHRLDIDVTVQAGQITAEEPAWSGAVQLTARRLDLQDLVALRTWLDYSLFHMTSY